MSRSHDTKSAPSRRHVIKAVLAAGFAAPAILRVGSALAAYPDRPVRIVVANTPGGPSDIIARFMAAAMQEATGGSFIVENKGGGGGNIGMGLVARADADGYTILLSTSAFAINPGLYETQPYDPFKDFTAICELAISPHVFAVKPELPAKTMKEFVALAKADPDKFNVSVPPIGTAPQLQAEVLKLREGLQKMATVPFAGGGDALKALISGTVQLSSGVLRSSVGPRGRARRQGPGHLRGGNIGKDVLQLLSEVSVVNEETDIATLGEVIALPVAGADPRSFRVDHHVLGVGHSSEGQLPSDDGGMVITESVTLATVDRARTARARAPQLDTTRCTWTPREAARRSAVSSV